MATTTKTADKSTEFILKLSGIELPADVKERIAAELRATLLRELAQTDTGGGASASAAKLTAIPVKSSGLLIPVGWNGGLLITPSSAISLKDAVTQLDKTRLEAREVAV